MYRSKSAQEALTLAALKLAAAVCALCAVGYIVSAAYDSVHRADVALSTIHPEH